MRFTAWLVVLVVAGCLTVPDSKPDCGDDASLCPQSEKSATAVACSCSCELPTIPLSGTKAPTYRGNIVTCLPPALNPRTGTEVEQAAVTAMVQSQFDQNVFKFCSEDVAQWLSRTVASQVRRLAQIPEALACQPYKCTCSTEGASIQSAWCEDPCEETRCDEKTCMPILRRGGILSPSSCICTRTEACGDTSPPASKPPLCRPLTLSR
jgi:hypothetical protein